MRCCEQIKVNLGYMKTKVIMTGLASGLILGSFNDIVFGIAQSKTLVF